MAEIHVNENKESTQLSDIQLSKNTESNQPSLNDIQQQLNELKTQVSQLQQQINSNSQTNQNNSSSTTESTKISDIENSLQLVSDIVRYQPLRDMLAAKKWEEADTETIRLISDIAGHDDIEDFRTDEVMHFP